MSFRAATRPTISSLSHCHSGLFGVRYIFDHHDANPELYLSKYERRDAFYKVQVWLEKLTYRSASIVMATNESYKSLAMGRGGFDEKMCSWFEMARILKRLSLSLHKPALKHGKTFLVGYVGTMSIQEGLDILIDVAAEIKARGRTDVHFTCVGGGPGLPALQRMVKERNLGEMMNFTGRVPDKNCWRFFLLPMSA